MIIFSKIVKKFSICLIYPDTSPTLLKKLGEGSPARRGEGGKQIEIAPLTLALRADHGRFQYSSPNDFTLCFYSERHVKVNVTKACNFIILVYQLLTLMIIFYKDHQFKSLQRKIVSVQFSTKTPEAKFLSLYVFFSSINFFENLIYLNCLNYQNILSVYFKIARLSKSKNGWNEPRYAPPFRPHPAQPAGARHAYSSLVEQFVFIQIRLAKID